MSNRKLARELDALFPASMYQLDPATEAELNSNEAVIWLGGPERWGLFRITPFLYAIAGAVVLLGFQSYEAGYLDPIGELRYLLALPNGMITLLLPLLWVGLLLFAMRDPRDRWRFVVTDQRLLVMRRGRKLREAGPDDFEHLWIIDDFEGRLRNLGHVVWRVHIRTSGGTGGGGPDHGQHGFRGLRDPRQWLERLLAWRTALHKEAARSSEAFVASSDSAGTAATDSRGRLLLGNSFGFRVAVPSGWSGEVGTMHSSTLKILGIDTPFKRHRVDNKASLQHAGSNWNWLRMRTAGVSLAMDVRPGHAEHSFESFTQPIASIVQASEEHIEVGGLTGWSVDYPLDTGKEERVRYVLLQGPQYHLVINARVSASDGEAQLLAVAAVIDSIELGS